MEQHSSVAEAIVRPHPSYSPEEKARQREISPTYSSDASNACTPRKGACPENPPSSFLAHAREEVLNDMVLAVVEEWDADYGIKIVYTFIYMRVFECIVFELAIVPAYERCYEPDSCYFQFGMLG